MKTKTPAISPLLVPCPRCHAGVDQFCTGRDGHIQAALHDARRQFARDPDAIWLTSGEALIDVFAGGEL